MKRSYTRALFFILIILSLIYSILVNNKRVDDFFKFHRNISDIVIVNDNLNEFINSPINFKNFDSIKDNIILANEKIAFIQKDVFLLSDKNGGFKEDFYLLKNSLEKKIKLIEKLKSHRAVLNNSFRNIIKLFPNIENREYIKLYTKIVTLNINSEFKKDEILKMAMGLNSSSKYEKLFLLHSNVISRELSKYNKIKGDIKNLRLDTYITKFEYKYSSFIKSIIEEVKDTMLILILILAFHCHCSSMFAMCRLTAIHAPKTPTNALIVKHKTISSALKVCN